MSLLNQVTVVGNMSARPSITTFDSGTMVARFSVQVDPGQRVADDARNTQYVRAFAWGNIARFVQSYLDEGSRMAVMGKLVSRTYVNKEGKPQRVTEVEVRRVVKLPA